MTNKFEVVEILGRGGFGIVEKIRDSGGSLFARKTFSPASYIPSGAHDKLRQRFKREVLTQKELGGNEIIPILAADLIGPAPWFIMPLAEKTYDTQIADDKVSGSVDIDAIADILNDLQYLHELGYTHRDLNPKNILKHDSRWKLSDLGAVLPPDGHTVTLTEGTVIYTEQYCAPEQRNSFHAAKSSADVFSFGCILHDIFGIAPRIPYAHQTASGPVGILIEKCTEINPLRRPTIKVLRGMLLDTLVEMGGHCKIADEKSEHWLEKLRSIETWDDTEFGNFARFFAQLDLKERIAGHEKEWLYSLSTPFLTRLPAKALVQIAKRNDGVASAVIEKFCEWARTNEFLFHYADTVCDCLTEIFDNGDLPMKAQALTALILLAESHNRFYVMRCMLNRCSSDSIGNELARRLAIEIRTEEIVPEFKRCIETVNWDVKKLAADLVKL